MNNTSFSYQLRVAACDRCGAPLEATVGGGSFTCRFCNAQNQLKVRDEGLIAPPRPPIHEAERINRLRMQDGRPLLPPPAIAHLFGPGGTIEDWKEQEAIAVWNGARQELRNAPGNYDAAERLVFLSMFLSQHFQRKTDLMRQRSLLEGALDVVTLPRHRQILRGYIARAAVRAGDIAAAEAWLKPCDPASDDLQMDSAYRFTRAFIDTATGNFQRVLQVLGQGPHDVPIEDASDDVCAVFRANAWEKMGRPDVAVNLLRERFAAGGGTGRQTITRVIEVYAQWHLCAQSYPQASAGYAHVAAQKAATRASGGIHKAFVPVGILMLVIGLGLLAMVPIGLVMDMDLHESIGGFGFGGGMLVFMGLVFGGIGFAMKKSAEKAAWLRVHGIQGNARIQDVSGTGTTINNVPMLQFTLLVTIPGHPPYQATAKQLGMGGLSPGGNIAVRVNPRNLQELIMETD